MGWKLEMELKLVRWNIRMFPLTRLFTLAAAALFATHGMAQVMHAPTMPTSLPPTAAESPEIQRIMEIIEEGVRRERSLARLVQYQFDRRLIAQRSADMKFVNDLKHFRDSSMTLADRKIIIQVLEHELSKDKPDWLHIQWALYAAKYGFSGNDELVPFVRRILEFPRGEKISGSHGVSLRAGLEALGSNDRPTALSLLDEATNPSFWHVGGPVRSQQIATDADQSIRTLCRFAEEVRSGWPVDLTGHINYELFRLPIHISTEDPRIQRIAAILKAGESRVDAFADALREQIVGPELPTDIEAVIVRGIENARQTPLEPKQYEALLELIANEVSADSPDWPLLRFALCAAFLHGGHDDEMTVQVRRLLERPRPDLMPDVQWDALETALALAGRIGTEKSVGLLLEATKLSFWETGGPVLWEMVATHGGGAIPVEVARTEAVMAIKYAPAAVAHDALTAIANDYPNASSRFDPSRRLETSAPYYIDMAMAFVERRDGPMPEPHASLSRENEP